MHENEEVKDKFDVITSSDKVIHRQKSYIKKADAAYIAMVVVYAVCYYIVVN